MTETIPIYVVEQHRTEKTLAARGFGWPTADED